MLDTAIAGYQVFRTVTAIAGRDSDYSNAPISRKADIAAGAGLFGLFAVSATYGYVTAADCDEAKGQRAREIRQLHAAPSQTAPGSHPAIPVTHPAPTPTPAPTPLGTPAYPPQSTLPPPSPGPTAPSTDGGTDLTRDAPF